MALFDCTAEEGLCFDQLCGADDTLDLDGYIREDEKTLIPVSLSQVGNVRRACVARSSRRRTSLRVPGGHHMDAANPYLKSCLPLLAVRTLYRHRAVDHTWHQQRLHQVRGESFACFFFAACRCRVDCLRNQACWFNSPDACYSQSTPLCTAQTTSMESDNFITVCENSGDSTQVVTVDLKNRRSVVKRPISAEAAIMNPVSQVLALRGACAVFCDH